MSTFTGGTTTLDLPLPAPINTLDEVVLQPVAPDSSINTPIGDTSTMTDTTSPLQTQMAGVDALLAAELESGDASIQDSQNSQDIIPVFSQEPIIEGTTPPSSAISSHNQSQSQQAQQQETRLRGGQLGLEIPSVDGSRPKTSFTAGQKRTIDGYVRRSSSSSSSRSSTPQTEHGVPDPKRHAGHKGHSRNISAISTTSSAMSPRELTNELKTRLSYAMVKVQKGWESLPLYDLESLASQNGSPSSSGAITINGRRTSAFGSAFTSPRVALARDQSSLSDKDTVMRDPVVVPEGQNGNAMNNGYSRTYESFWRSQTQRTLTSPSNAQHASLQPPADLGSAQRPNGYLRRSPSKTSQPQRSGLSQSTSDLSTSSRFSSSNIPALPRTPKEDMASRITTALINNTSAQKGIIAATTSSSTPIENSRAQAENKKTQSMQEQDAIETLLFMSSPGNGNPLLNFPIPIPTSQTPSSQNQQGSPLKTSFSNSPSQITTHNPTTTSSASRPTQKRFFETDERLYAKLNAREAQRREMEERRKSGGRLTGEEVERLIDSYKGESSDDEVEIEIPKRSARRSNESTRRQGEVVEQERQRQVSGEERGRVALPTSAGSG